MMRTLIGALAALITLPTHGKSLEAEGGCPTQRPVGMLRRAAEPPWAGGPKEALQAPAFANAHAAGAAGESPWLSALAGRAGANRIYVERGRHIVVLTVCNPEDCDGERAYVAFDPATGAWSANVFEGRQVRSLVPGAGQTTLAVPSEPIGTALVCAANLDMGGK